MQSFPRILKKAFLTGFLLALLFQAGMAQNIDTRYEVNVSGTGAEIVTLIDITTEERSEPWKLSWTLPVDGTVQTVADESGEVDYTVDGREIEFTTNRDTDFYNEQIRIVVQSPGLVNTEYTPLKKLEMQLSQLQTAESTGTVKAVITVDEPILSWRTGHNVNHEKDDASTIRFSSTDPFNPKLFFSSQGKRTEHFAVFDKAGTGYTPTAAEEFYGVIPATTGFQPPFQRFPVVILSNETYQGEVDAWSAGQYLGGGLIVLKEGTVTAEEDGACSTGADRAAATLLHETMHGFNEYALYWDRTQSSWFDEGTGKYVEYVVNNLQEVRQAEIFGEEQTWESGRNRCTLRPRHTPEDLYTYYTEDQGFMPTWSPTRSTGDIRRFGYAFSELYIRDIIRRNGFDALHDAYTSLLNQESRVETVDQKQQVVESATGAAFTPCNAPSLSQVEACTDKVNGMQVEFPRLDVTVKQITGGDVGGVNTRLQNLSSKDIPGSNGFLQGLLRSTVDVFAFIGSLILSVF